MPTAVVLALLLARPDVPLIPGNSVLVSAAWARTEAVLFAEPGDGAGWSTLVRGAAQLVGGLLILLLLGGTVVFFISLIARGAAQERRDAANLAGVRIRPAEDGFWVEGSH